MHELVCWGNCTCSDSCGGPLLYQMFGAESAGRTCGEVLSERTISSSGMRCAGLKKWAPMIRSAACKQLYPP